MVPGVPCVDRGILGIIVRRLVLSCARSSQKKTICIMQCFVKTVFQIFMSCTLILHTNAHAVRRRPTLNDVERFRNGSSIHELYSLKASQMCKVHTSFV